MIKLDDFIYLALNQIKAGIDEFNECNEYARAYLPEQVTFEAMVDNDNNIGGNNKVIVTVPITNSNPACKRK